MSRTTSGEFWPSRHARQKRNALGDALGAVRARYGWSIPGDRLAQVDSDTVRIETADRHIKVAPTLFYVLIRLLETGSVVRIKSAMTIRCEQEPNRFDSCQACHPIADPVKSPGNNVGIWGRFPGGCPCRGSASQTVSKYPSRQ